MKINIYHSKNADEWDEVVRSFTQYDVHYLSGYAKSYQTLGSGEPLLIYVVGDSIRAINVVMLQDIAETPQFEELIPKDTYFDIATPFGYGGFMIEGEITTEKIEQLNQVYLEFCRKKRIVSEFVRLQPMIQNAKVLDSMYEISQLGYVVEMKLESQTQIWNDLSSPKRRVIRKAIKNGVEIYYGNDPCLLEQFLIVYNQSMKRLDAREFYYFNDAFFNSIQKNLKHKYMFFYAVYEDKIISSVLVLFANKVMYYFLSGSDSNYYSLSPASYLIYEAALWGMEHGYVKFCLGDGLPSLHRFKQSFNKHSDLYYEVGKKIFDETSYNFLVTLRKESGTYDEDSSFFPAYRR